VVEIKFGFNLIRMLVLKIFNDNLNREATLEITETEITVNGVTYVPKGTENNKAEKIDGMRYCIVRTYSAGVFAGYVKDRIGKEGVVVKSRRLWRWSGAASLSQLAVDGTNAPNECKFPCEVATTELTEIIEVIECTEKAKKSISEVAIWTA